MRIGVLEWASCGGAVGSKSLSDSIRHEGWAMCRALLESVSCAGHHPVACLLDGLNKTGFRARPTSDQSMFPLDLNRDVRDQWCEVYRSCDATIVVAPESDGIQLELEAWCASSGIHTCSSDVEFIEHAGDKWLTAQCWEHNHVPHPATQLLSQWNVQAAGNGDVGTWVIKTRDGAGCDGMRRVATFELRATQTTCEAADRWIVQPWLNGQAYSRTAIVDAADKCHWLPVVRQHLLVDTKVSYRGGFVLPEFVLSEAQAESLQRSVTLLPGTARGWIGVDFLIDDKGELIVIEVNPRLTTSFVGLSAACDASLAEMIWRAKMGLGIDLPRAWRCVKFEV